MKIHTYEIGNEVVIRGRRSKANPRRRLQGTVSATPEDPRGLYAVKTPEGVIEVKARKMRTAPASPDLVQRLSELGVAALRALAKGNVKGYGKMAKKDLVQSLAKAGIEPGE